MKLTHKLCGAALLAVIGVSVVLPNATKADDKSLSNGMDIEFTRNTDSDTGGFILTTGSGQGTITEGITITDVGDFGVRAVSPLNFGLNKAVTDGNARTYWAKNWLGKGTGGNSAAANVVEIKDTRSTNDHTYNLTAKITEEFTGNFENVSTKLTGATLNFYNPIVQSDQPAALALKSTMTRNGVEVAYNTPSQPIVDNTEAGTGLGKSQIFFGDYAAAADAVTSSEKSVKLTVPADQDLKDTTYRGTILWTLSTTK